MLGRLEDDFDELLLVKLDEVDAWEELTLLLRLDELAAREEFTLLLLKLERRLELNELCNEDAIDELDKFEEVLERELLGAEL